jgi:hypothetical protein
VSTVGDALHVKAPAFSFIEGQVLAWLRDGRSVHLDFELNVLARQGGSPVAQDRQSFVMSFDLWEERFAVTRVGTPPRSVSHLTSRNAEAWCLEHVTVPVGRLGSLGRDAPLWVRLAYRVQSPVSELSPEDERVSSLERLIGILGRRRQDGTLGKSMEAGPFLLPR